MRYGAELYGTLESQTGQATGWQNPGAWPAQSDSAKRHPKSSRRPSGSRTLAVSAALVEAGAPLSDISRRLYRVKTGDIIGRLKVTQIRPREVVFTVQEFGFERQETLSLRKPEVDTP